MLDARTLCEGCVKWIADWFEPFGPDSCAVVGMSGGKDSTVVAALCAKALGPSRVWGVAMPSNGQSLNEADEICAYLGIHYLCLPIGAVESSCRDLGSLLPLGAFSHQSILNIPPRLRMTLLYAVAQSVGGMVANTCNLSEDYIGYATLFGDAAGSFAPLGQLCVQEILEIGRVLGLPEKWVGKTPDDGLPGSMPDEEKFGFSYAVLDRYIREGVCEDEAVRAKIDRMHRCNRFKTDILHIPCYQPGLEIKAKNL
jgi:NAD+ synthase